MKLANKPYSILIIEDNEGDYRIIENCLAELHPHHDLYHTENFQETQQFVEGTSTRLDVILLDINLPDRNGEDLLLSLQKIAGNTPIIILTGQENTDFAIKLLSLGVSDYLLKDHLTPLIIDKSISYSIERNKALLTVKYSEQRYADLFHFSPQPMWVFDCESLRFLDVNEAAIIHYGYTYEEFLSMRIIDIRPPSEVPKLQRAVSLARSTPKLVLGEFLHQKKNGDIIQVEIRSNIINFKDRSANIILINDVTQRNIQVQAVKEQNEKLKEIAWAQSHLVRAPLARLMGLVNFLADDSVQEDAKNLFIKHIQKSAQELDKIVRDTVKKAQQTEIKDIDQDKRNNISR